MAEIGYKIGEGVFSQVMKSIATILTTEYVAQIALGNTFLPTSAGYDNIGAVNEDEYPYVSVDWLKFDNRDDFRNNQANINNFYIDVKAIGVDNVRKIIAVTRTILKAKQYIILNFASGVISDTNIINAGITFEESNRSSQGVISGGLTFQCLVNEINPSPTSTELNETLYESSINETDKIITLKNEY